MVAPQRPFQIITHELLIPHCKDLTFATQSLFTNLYFNEPKLTFY